MKTLALFGSTGSIGKQTLEVLRAFPELKTPKTTSINVVEIIRCLRLKVWDVDAQQMIRLPKA